MININQIEEKIVNMVEAGHKLPSFAYVSADSMKSIFNVHYFMSRIEKNGFNYCKVYTRFGEITILAMKGLSNNDLILCNNYNLLLDILVKLNPGEEYAWQRIY